MGTCWYSSSQKKLEWPTICHWKPCTSASMMTSTAPLTGIIQPVYPTIHFLSHRKKKKEETETKRKTESMKNGPKLFERDPTWPQQIRTKTTSRWSAGHPALTAPQHWQQVTQWHHDENKMTFAGYAPCAHITWSKCKIWKSEARLSSRCKEVVLHSVHCCCWDYCMPSGFFPPWNSSMHRWQLQLPAKYHYSNNVLF